MIDAHIVPRLLSGLTENSHLDSEYYTSKRHERTSIEQCCEPPPHHQWAVALVDDLVLAVDEDQGEEGQDIVSQGGADSTAYVVCLWDSIL